MTTGTRPRVSARVAAIGESLTLAVDARAKALKAAGRHHYTPSGGQPALRQAIAEKTRRDSGYPVSAAQVLVTNGGKQAIYQAFAAILDPGDEVIVPAPYWTTYPEAIRLAGGVPVAVVADESTGYRVGVEQLEAARTPATKALLFVSPSNPTGAVHPPDEVEAIGRWAAGRGLWVLTDEIYGHLVYDGAAAPSLPVLVPELAAVTAAANLQSHLSSNVCNVAQAAALAAVSGDLLAAAAIREVFDRRRRTMVAMLNEIDGVTCPLPQGAFYAYPSVKALLGRPLRGRRPADTLELADLILDEAEVAVVPGEAFGTPGYLRLSYALGDDDLVEGVGRLQSLFAGSKP